MDGILLTPAEINLLNEGKIIEVIRAVRWRTGCMLKEAKRVVDDYLASPGAREKAGFVTKDCPRCGGTGKVTTYA